MAKPWSFYFTQLHPHTAGSLVLHDATCPFLDFASSPRWLGFISMTRVFICNVQSEITVLALTCVTALRRIPCIHIHNYIARLLPWFPCREIQRGVMQFRCAYMLIWNLIFLSRDSKRHVDTFLNPTNENQPYLLCSAHFDSVLYFTMYFFIVIIIISLSQPHKRLFFFLLINLDVKACSCALNLPL